MAKFDCLTETDGVYGNVLKVKCNEIWSIFLFPKNLHKKVSYTNRKQNQLLKISANYGAQDTNIRQFPRASRKRIRNGSAWSGNEILGFVTSYLASPFLRPNNFLEMTEFVSRISLRLLTSRCIK